MSAHAIILEAFAHLGKFTIAQQVYNRVLHHDCNIEIKTLSYLSTPCTVVAGCFRSHRWHKLHQTLPRVVSHVDASEKRFYRRATIPYLPNFYSQKHLTLPFSNYECVCGE